MSRIYHDCALRNKAVRSARLPGAWDPAAHQGRDYELQPLASAPCPQALAQAAPLPAPEGRTSCSDPNSAGQLACRGRGRAVPAWRRVWARDGGGGGCRRDVMRTNGPFHLVRNARIWRGNGVLLEGELVDVSRHSILDAHDRKERYYVLYIRPSRIHRRKFDPKGNEIEPNFSATRKVNTGFLMSSYKVEAMGDTDRLTPEALKALVQKPELLALTESLTPAQTVAFWMSESEMEAMELELGVGVRLKTRGDGPFLESLAKLEAGTVTKCNFAGDGKTGASWTDNIMAQKSTMGATAETREQGDGAEDEEWDD
ncbi:arpin isoform X1 [Callorhinus ursinus]|uniref:Arpin n=3 Tax=Otariidae TaxID=9702 RepID=A0A3Q7QSS7_CALUR|nr:arpin isoform X1 [Callorhinus ursinus]